MSRPRGPSPPPFELDPATARLVPEPEAQDPAVEPPAPARVGRRRSRLGLVLFGALGGLLILQAIRFVTDRIARDPWSGWPTAALLLVLLASLAALVGRELAQLRRLHRRAWLRERAGRLVGSQLHGEGRALLEAIGRELASGPGSERALAAYREQASDALADGERLVLFERTVLAPIDRRAYRLVLESARDIGVLTALSPVGLLDALLVLWRTSILLRSIAELYGMTPGPTAALALFRRCLRNALLAGAADVVTEAALEHAGASLLATLSARAGQGAGNALLAAKLGLEAIRETRPLPFVVEEPPRLARIREALLRARPAD